MDCRHVREVADSVLSEQLLVETNHEVLRHLGSCAACRADLEMRRRLRVSLKAAFKADASLRVRPEFVTDVTAALRARAGRRRGLAPWLRSALLAAAALCIVAVGIWTNERVGARRFLALAQAAAGDHQNCAVHFRLGEDPISLEEAGRRFGAVYPALSSVAPLPPPVGGDPITVLERHECLFDGRRFAHLVVRYRGRLASVIVPGEGRPAGGERLLHVGGASVASITASGHPVFIVSSSGDADLGALVRAFQGPLSRALSGV
jgi:anti-sigma factor RsiW